MIRAISPLLPGLLTSCAVVGLTIAAVARLTPAERRVPVRRWIIAWALKGVLLPTIAWAFMNADLTWWLPSFMPELQAIQNSGQPWLGTFFKVAGSGMFIVSSYWAALTLGWSLWAATRELEGEKRLDFLSLGCGSTVLMIVVSLLLLLSGGWYALGAAVFALLAPIAWQTAPILEVKKRPPTYSRAVAKMKFGKYAEAEWNIIQQLEEYEDDFDGWMMLAALYAEKYGDLQEAERTITDICGQPNVNISQIAVALNRLADWHLNLGNNPAAARAALHKICERMPGTHPARMAQIRIQQLPMDRVEAAERKAPQRVYLPALGDAMDAPAPDMPGESRQAAANAANACTTRLQENPNDVPARERLARLLAERLDRPAQGIEQLQLLLEMADQADGKRAEWLSLIAAWRLKYTEEPEAGRATLERLVREYPATVQAMAARRRLVLLDREQRGQA